jgi:hypothetical protein
VSGDALVPDAVSEVLGCTPTFACLKGEVRQCSSGRAMRQPTGLWMTEESISDAGDVGAAVSRFLARFPQDEAAWSVVASMGDVLVVVTVWFSEENASAPFPSALLAQLGKMRAELLVDVWRLEPSDPAKSSVRG